MNKRHEKILISKGRKESVNIKKIKSSKFGLFKRVWSWSRYDPTHRTPR